MSGSGTIRSASSLSSNESEFMNKDSQNNSLTFQNLKNHDYLHHPISTYRPKKYLGDDESSIYSLDEQGYFTSMHKDCGVKKSTDDLLGFENDTSVSQYSSSSTMNSYGDKGKSKRGSFLSKLSSLKRDKKKKKTAPPPPPRGSVKLSKSNLELEELPAPDTPPLTTPTEIRKLACLAQKIAGQKEKEAEIRAQAELQQKVNDLDMGDHDTTYARLKSKTSFSSSTYPALCLVTPEASDEEDGDMVDYSSAWRSFGSNSNSSSSLKSSCSAPGNLEDMKSLPGERVFLRMESIKEDSHEQMLDSSKDDTVLDTSKHDSSAADSDISGFATWPRSPSAKGEMKTVDCKLFNDTNKPKTRPDVKPPTLNKQTVELLNCESEYPDTNTHPQSQVSDGAKRPSSLETKRVCPPAILNIARGTAISKVPTSSSEGSSNRVSQSVPLGTFKGQPLPATARLIISSPVANRACFVENPHKRSVCSPVTMEELVKYKSYNSSDNWYNTLPRKINAASKETMIDGPEEANVPQSPKLNVNAMPNSFTTFEFPIEFESLGKPMESAPTSMPGVKWSASFPVPTLHEADIPSTYGRTWYDGLDTKACVVEEACKPEPVEKPKMSFTSFLKEPSTHVSNPSVTVRSRRDSTASTLSSSSSSSGKKTLSSVTAQRTSMSSLATRSSDCSSSASDVPYTNVESQTVVIKTNTAPGMKLCPGVNSQDGKPLSTFSLAPSVSLEKNPRMELSAPVDRNTTLKSDVPTPKVAHHSYSNQRPKAKIKTNTMITTSFVGTEGQGPRRVTCSESNSCSTKQGHSGVIYATALTGNIGTIKDNISGRAVVSFEDSRPVTCPKAPAGGKVMISANSAKKSNQKTVVVSSPNIDNCADISSKAITRANNPCIESRFPSPSIESKQKKCDKYATGNTRETTCKKVEKEIQSARAQTWALSLSKEKTRSDVSTKPIEAPVLHCDDGNLSTCHKVGRNYSNKEEGVATMQEKKDLKDRPGEMSVPPSTVNYVGHAIGDKSKRPKIKPPLSLTTNVRQISSSLSKKTSAFDSEQFKPSPRKFVLPSVKAWPPSSNVVNTVKCAGDGSNKEPKVNGILKSSLNKSLSNLIKAAHIPDCPSNEENEIRHRSLKKKSRPSRWSVADMSLSSSATNLHVLSNLSTSAASLARSSESLASNSSLSDRNRALKLSFLSTDNGNSSITDINDRFEIHRAKLSSSRTSLNSLRYDTESPSVHNLSSSRSSLNKSDRNEKRVSPVQGRFVSSLISQFQAKQSVESLSSPTTSNSSGLGGSLPGSPDSMPSTPQSDITVNCASNEKCTSNGSIKSGVAN